MDVLEPLEVMQGHMFYAAARDRILTLKRTHGFNYALREARRIAQRYEDAILERRLNV